MFKLIKANFIFFLLFLSFSAEGQIPNGSIAPNFNVFDLDSVEIKLNEWLAEDKAVIIDFFATWCTPCWTVHESKILEDLYSLYGPDGTDEIRVIGIESDPGTDIADILGTGNNTIGDWTEYTNYPFSNDFTVGPDFQRPGYPSVFIVRPNGRVFFGGDIFTVEFLDANALQEAYSTAAREANDARLESDIHEAVEYCSPLTIQPKTILLNYGDSSLTEATIELYANDDLVETKTWTGTLHTFQSAEVLFSSIEIKGNVDLSYVVKLPNGQSDTDTSDNEVVQEFRSNLVESKLFLHLRTDFWPEDNSWEIKDLNTNEIIFNSDDVQLVCDSLYLIEFEFEDESCFEFAIIDNLADGIFNGPVTPGSHDCPTTNGMNNQAMGQVLITNGVDTLFNNNNFQFRGVTTFSTDFSSAQHDLLQLQTFHLFPNPTSEELNIELNSNISRRVDLQIINLQGQILNSSSLNLLANQNVKKGIDLRGLSPGIYFAQIRNSEILHTQKFLIIE